MAEIPDELWSEALWQVTGPEATQQEMEEGLMVIVELLCRISVYQRIILPEQLISLADAFIAEAGAERMPEHWSKHYEDHLAEAKKMRGV